MRDCTEPWDGCLVTSLGRRRAGAQSLTSLSLQSTTLSPSAPAALHALSTVKGQARKEKAKGWWETAADGEMQKCLLHVKQVQKQQYNLISKSVTQLNCFAVCFDIEWILAVHMRTAFHEQQFDTCSMVWITFSGVPHWAITCLQFGW